MPFSEIPRTAPGRPTRLIVGRAKLPDGGTIAGRAAVVPSIVFLFGLTSRVRTGLIRLSWLGEIRIALRATGSELTSVLRGTAVNPLGARKLA